MILSPFLLYVKLTLRCLNGCCCWRGGWRWWLVTVNADDDTVYREALLPVRRGRRRSWRVVLVGVGVAVGCPGGCRVFFFLQALILSLP